MPRGGWRGGGRPTKAAAEAKAKALLEAIEKGPRTTPRALLQGIMDNPKSTAMERLKACELFQKLPNDPLPSASVSSAPPMVLLGIPRGIFLSEEQAANPESLIPYGVPIEPFTATSSIDATQTKRQTIEHLEPEPVPFESPEPTPPSNVQPLRPFERIHYEGERHDASRRPAAMNPHHYRPCDD
jgi:hypothetical protein